MGAGTEWKCNNCGYTINTSGPWEFYRNAVGRRGVYGHPKPTSKEAAQTGIKGYFVKWYCPNCRTVEDSVEIEFKEHVDRHEQWNQLEMALPPKAFCTSCGAELQERLDGDEICPKCNKGKFELKPRSK